MFAPQYLPWLIWLAMVALMLAFARRPLARPRIDVEAIMAGRPLPSAEPRDGVCSQGR